MKRRLMKVLAICLMMTTVLAGCSKGEPAPQEPVGDVVENTSVSIIGTGTYQVDDVVTIDHIIKIDDAAIGNVVQTAILSSTGTLITELDTSEKGTFEVTVLVEFNDSTSFSGTYAYTVEGPSGDEEAMSLLKNAKDYDVVTVSNGSIFTVLHDGVADFYTVVTNNSDVVYEDGSISLTSTSKDKANYMSFVKDGIEYFIAYNDVADDTFIDYAKFTEPLFSDIPVVDEETELTDEELYELNYTTMLQNLIQDKGIENVGTLWSIDGRQYTVERSLVGIKYSYMTGQVSDDVVLTASYRLTDVETADTITLNMINSDLAGAIVFPFIMDVPEDTEIPTEYEEYISFMRENFNASERVKEDIFSVEEVREMILAGQLITTDKETNTESVDGIEDEIQEIPNDTIAKQATYSERHPEIYTWPDNETKYRRWCYVITPSTTYNQVIYFEDGTYRLSTGEYEDSVTVGDEGSGQSESTPGGDGKVTTHNIVSPYATYVLSNSKDSNITFDYNTSNASMLVFTYSGQKYFVESVKSSDITKYQKNSLYNLDYFKDGQFTVTASNEEKRATSLGQIIPYNVSYVDPNSGRTVKSGYMCVYNIQNDYLCIYSENLASTISLMGLLENVVIEVK